MEVTVVLGRGITAMKNWLAAIVIFAGGVLVGVAVHPVSVRAQATTAGNVYVDELVGRTASGTTVRGSQIVGFSCAEDGNGSIHCYAASVSR